MIKLRMETKEVDIELTYEHLIGAKPFIKVIGKGDLPHHLIEGAFQIVEKLAKMEDVGHRKEEYKIKRRYDGTVL